MYLNKTSDYTEKENVSEFKSNPGPVKEKQQYIWSSKKRKCHKKQVVKGWYQKWEKNKLQCVWIGAICVV